MRCSFLLSGGTNREALDRVNMTRVLTEDQRDAAWQVGHRKYEAWARENERTRTAAEAEKREEFERYRSVLGDLAPKTVESFLELQYNKPEEGETLRQRYRQQKSDIRGIMVPIVMSKEQIGKKIGKHARDYNLDPSKLDDRETLISIIHDIRDNYTEVRRGKWRMQQGEVFFFIKGEDVIVVSPNGIFITILKGGINNERIKNARRVEI